MAENETQQTTEETTEAVATQSPATDKGIDDPPTAADENAKTEDTKSEESSEAIAETKTEEPEEEEEISYHAVEKEGDITAIWEMQGSKHIRTISPRSTEGQKILNLFTSDIHETDSPPMSADAS